MQIGIGITFGYGITFGQGQEVIVLPNPYFANYTFTAGSYEQQGFVTVEENVVLKFENGATWTVTPDLPNVYTSNVTFAPGSYVQNSPIYVDPEVALTLQDGANWTIL